MGRIVRPIAYLFQHDETGRTQCVEAQQVEWGWEVANPRWINCGPLYTIPDGWALVPVDPTPKMLDAAEAIDWGDADVRGSCCNQWHAMVAAVPNAAARRREAAPYNAEVTGRPLADGPA